MAKCIEQLNLKPLSLNTKILFFEQLCTYIGASIPLSTTLVNIEKYTPNRDIKIIAHILLHEIDKGENFSDAILKFKKALGGVYCNLLALGAQSGELARISNDIYNSLKHQRELLIRILQQCAYPAFLFFVLLVPAVATLLFYIIPRFSQYYETLMGEVPTHIRAISTFTAIITNNWILLGIISGLLIFAITKEIKKLFKSKLIIKLPFLGTLIKNYNLSLFTKILAISYTAGIPITHGILISCEPLPNKNISEKLFKCSSMITKHPLTQTFASTGLFPPPMITKIQTGELTGELDKLLYEISQDIDRTLEASISTLVKLLEPTLMIIIAVFVGLYALTIVSTI